MSATEITAIVAVVIAGISSIIVPLYLRRQATAQAASRGQAVSWQTLTADLQRDRADLRAELRASDEECKRKIRDLETDYTQQLVLARARISQLEKEVEELYRRLYRAGSGPSP